MPAAFQPFLEAFKHSRNKRGSVAAPTSTALLTGGTFGTGTANRSQYLATSAAALTFSANADVGVAELVRANAAQSQTKSHWEWKPVSLNTSTGSSLFLAGITDAATVSFTSFLATNRYPGQTDGTTPVPGFTVKLTGNALNGVIAYINGAAGASWSFGGATFQLNADALIFENDATTSANVCKVYFYDASVPSTTLIGTATLSGSYLLTSTYAFGGGSWSTGGPDSATVNFGASANLVTPTAGYSIYA